MHTRTLTQGATTGFGATMRGLFALAVREARMRRDARMLREADDHLLHDIGLMRSQIEQAVRTGRRP